MTEFLANGAVTGAQRSRPPMRRIGLLIFGVVTLGLLLYWLFGVGPPDREEVAADLVFGGDLLAYEVHDGAPLVVFRTTDGLAVRRGRLQRDLLSIEWPPTPAWQLSGHWFSIVSSTNPAGVGLIPANPPELFGEVHDPRITTLEVEYEGAWHAFPVSAPGYLVRLNGFDGIPTAYRWLDAEGAVVYVRDAVEPLTR